MNSFINPTTAALTAAGIAVGSEKPHARSPESIRYSEALDDMMSRFRAAANGKGFAPVTVTIPSTEFDKVGFKEAKERGFDKIGASNWIAVDAYNCLDKAGFELSRMAPGPNNSMTLTATKRTKMQGIGHSVADSFHSPYHRAQQFKPEKA